MIKKLLLVISFGIVFAVYGGNIGTFDRNRDTWLVDTGKIKCEFLEGCMYPSAFQKEGYYYPDFSLLDEYKMGLMPENSMGFMVFEATAVIALCLLWSKIIHKARHLEKTN